MRTNGKWRNLTFSKRLLLSMVGIILLVSILLIFLSYKFAISSINLVETALTERSAENAYNQIETVFNGMFDSLTQIVQMPSLRKISKEPDPDSVEANIYLKQLNGDIQSFIYTNSISGNSSLTFLNIYFKNGVATTTKPSLKLSYDNFDAVCAYLETKGVQTLDLYVPAVWFDTIVISTASDDIARSILCARFLYDSVSMEKTGVVIAGLDEGALSSLFATAFPSAYVIQKNGLLLSSRTKSSIGNITAEEGARHILETLGTEPPSSGSVRYLQNGENATALYWEIAKNNAFFIVPLDSDELLNSEASVSFAWRSIAASVCTMLIALLLALLLSRTLSKSILTLKKVVQEVYAGNLRARYIPLHNDEIAYLGRQFNDMLEQIEASFEQQEKDAAAKRALELRLLQEQINPHLLYNALSSAILAIRSRDHERAEKLIFSLSNFFRAALSEGREEITLAEEMNMVRSYMAIQRLGYGKKFSLKEEIPENLLDVKILRVTLQPLIENSVIHGFAGYRNDGEITIGAAADPDTKRLTLTVRDNGLGIEPDKLSEINRMIHNFQDQDCKKYFGFYNINRRIWNQYGKSYGLSVLSEVGNFTEVAIILPYKHDDEEKERSSDV